MSKFKVQQICGTCEFNFRGICAGGDTEHEYGHTITDLFDTCTCWGESYDYYTKINSNLPWYIKNPYTKGNANGKSDIELLEMDYNDEPIDVSIIELIEKTYQLNCGELAEVLNVSPGVIYRAIIRGVPEKRKQDFSSVLKIPEWYFDRVTTCDFPVIERCRDEFMKDWGESIPRIREMAEKKAIEKMEKQIAAAKPYITEEAARISNLCKSSGDYFHDLSDDYKMRKYIIAIRLQDREYKGNIFLVHGYSGYGLSPHMIDTIQEFIENLDCIEIEALNDEGLLYNDISIFSDCDKKEIYFTLKNDSGEILNECIPEDSLSNFVVGFEIIYSEGIGTKKERRKCITCKHFLPKDESAKGFCEIRRDELQRSRRVCAHGYEPITEAVESQQI